MLAKSSEADVALAGPTSNKIKKKVKKRKKKIKIYIILLKMSMSTLNVPRGKTNVDFNNFRQKLVRWTQLAQIQKV